MLGQSFNPAQFVSAQVHDAIYKTDNGDLSILLEMRQRVNGETEIYTWIHDEKVRAKSIPDLILSRSECLSLTINHDVPVIWGEDIERAILQETLTPNKQDPAHVLLSLKLMVDDIAYETSACVSLTEAIFELDEKVGNEVKWYLKICHSCKFSRPAFAWPVSDRHELRCYRDAPEAFAEIRNKGKFASRDALPGR